MNFDFTRKMIFELLYEAEGYTSYVNEPGISLHEAENRARHALGYIEAAQTLLGRFHELHNELIEHPKFVAARKFQREHGGL